MTLINFFDEGTCTGPYTVRRVHQGHYKGPWNRGIGQRPWTGGAMACTTHRGCRALCGPRSLNFWPRMGSTRPCTVHIKEHRWWTLPWSCKIFRAGPRVPRMARGPLYGHIGPHEEYLVRESSISQESVF